MGVGQDNSFRGKHVPAINPTDGSIYQALIPNQRIQWARKMGEGAILELAISVPKVPAEPRVLFQGLRRDEDDTRDDTGHWLCYCQKPGSRYGYRDGTIIGPANRVLMVFVNHDGVVYNHRWEPEDPEQPGFPSDRENRFRYQVLP